MLRWQTVRFHAIVIAAVMYGAGVAAAESAAELQAEGERAAKDGDYAGAIDKFKAADRIEPRASHACLIALAYTRRNLWPQAEIFKTQCHERASPSDPLPDWMGAADRQIDNAIAAANVAEVTISVDPSDALITVSSFALDEKFPPRVIHLAPGVHQISASAPGYEDDHRVVQITDKTPQHIVIELHKKGTVTRSASKVPWIVVGIGGAIAVSGAIVEATVYNTARNDYMNDYGNANKESDWERLRDVVIGCYVVGGLAVGTGIVLKYTVFEDRQDAPVVSFIPRDGGGLVSVGWNR